MSLIKNRFLRIINNPLIIISFIICKLRSFYFSRLIDEGKGKIIICKPFIKFKLKKGKDCKLIINGNVEIVSHLLGSSAINIILEDGSTLEIEGDFTIGYGVKIQISKDGKLHFGGREFESASGITADTIILVEKKIIIGTDFLCAWNVFISDSDWHQIGNQDHQKDVIIGDHVWVANNSSILKGSIIGKNSIVASQSKIINKEFPANSLIAGIPAKIVKSDISWSRDIISE